MKTYSFCGTSGDASPNARICALNAYPHLATHPGIPQCVKTTMFVEAFREEPGLGTPLLSGVPNLVPPECVFQNIHADARLRKAFSGNHRIKACRNQAEPSRNQALMRQNVISCAMRLAGTKVNQARNQPLIFKSVGHIDKHSCRTLILL